MSLQDETTSTPSEPVALFGLFENGTLSSNTHNASSPPPRPLQTNRKKKGQGKEGDKDDGGVASQGPMKGLAHRTSVGLATQAVLHQ